MRLIGIGHRCRQGKDVTCAAMAARAAHHGLTLRRYSIGDAVLEFCVLNAILPPVTREEIQVEHPEMLRVLQEVGQHQREHRPNIWLEKLFERMAVERPDIAVIPNIRVPAEAEYVKSRGGWTMKVERLNADGSPFIAMDRDANDETETALTLWNWDYVLRAKTGQLKWLQRQAACLLDQLVGAE